MLWDPFADLFSKIAAHGGFVNAHAHLDRAFSVTPQDLHNGEGYAHRPLQEKWQLVDELKRNSGAAVYKERILAAAQRLQELGVQACLSFIDVDPIAESRALIAAIEARSELEERGFFLRLACQTLKGVLEPEARRYFDASLDFVDIIGGLPGADAGNESAHLDVLLSAAKQTKKRVHVHVDQLNSPHERETELLARRVMAWGVEGQVTAVHGISIAAHPASYRKEVYKLCQDAGISFVCCPTAWLDCRRNETMAPTHNALTPVDEMIPLGIRVALGTDNIADIYKPFSDGDMRVELRTMLEAAHFYEFDALVKCATVNGFYVMGIENRV